MKLKKLRLHAFKWAFMIVIIYCNFNEINSSFEQLIQMYLII